MSFQLDCKINSTFWLWATFISGFLAFLFLYQKVSVWLKLLVVWCFASCFISRAPYMSFTMFWSVIICAYYYALCKRIEDWTPVKKVIQAIFFFGCTLIIMQLLGTDTLLNFRAEAPDIIHGGTPTILGTIGNKMIASSFFCILAPFLIYTPLNWIILILVSYISWSSGAVFSIGAGLAIYSWAKFKHLRVFLVVLAILAPIIFSYQTGKIDIFFKCNASRLPAWKDTIRLTLKNPLGYGIGTYKILFPVLCSDKVKKASPGQIWNTTHNDWLQIPFEIGYVGYAFFIGWIISIVQNVLKDKDYLKLAGLTIVAVNMLVHFPGRMAQCAFIILMFLAYCSQRREYGVND